MKIKLEIAYDGTHFAGWQKQKTPQPTIQGTLETALEKLLKHPVSLIGSGRTDSGVHAVGQIGHFSTEVDLERYNLLRALNSITPQDIVVKNAYYAPDEFHAIASAKRKVYKFLIHNSEVPTALRHRTTSWVRQPLDLVYLNQISQLILGEHDFKSFQSAGTDVKSTVRRIYSANWRQIGKNTIEFTIVGNGFLKQMVRNIVGTLLGLHKEKSAHEELLAILDKRDRRFALGTAHACGLYLYRVYYPAALDNRCRKI